MVASPSGRTRAESSGSKLGEMTALFLLFSAGRLMLSPVALSRTIMHLALEGLETLPPWLAPGSRQQHFPGTRLGSLKMHLEKLERYVLLVC